MTKRKGIGYMIEAIIAMITVFLFVLGNTTSPPSQDWNQFQKDIAANDIGHTLRKTGDLEGMMKRHETGSLHTSIETMTDTNIDVSGTISNIPRQGGRIGFHVTSDGINTPSISDVDSSDECYNDLEEIEEETGTAIKKTDSTKHGVHLYMADTGTEVANGYDSLWVDNGTSCQFSSAEGPFYRDEIFKWGNSSDPSEYAYYDFKNLTGSQDEIILYNATVLTEIRKAIGGSINGVKVNQDWDTFRISQDEIEDYDVAVFKTNDALNDINSNRQNMESFMQDGSVLLLMNLTESDFNTGFIRDTGMKWVDLGYDKTPSGAFFGDSRAGQDLETYFQGMNGDRNSIGLLPGGKVSSSNSNTHLEQRPAVYASQGSYRMEEWNATDWNMNPVAANTVTGVPETECITDGSQPSSNLTQGSITFPDGSTYDIINTELGQSLAYCEDRDVRALNIDLNGNGDFSDQGEGPLLNGERITVDDRVYRMNTYQGTASRDEGEAAEFAFSGLDRLEIVNYRTSFQGFSGERLARAPLMDYSENDRKLVASTLYWLLGDTTEFGSADTTDVSTTVVSGIEGNTYMPYRIVMRWQNQ